jgi:hypothetical protein
MALCIVWAGRTAHHEIIHVLYQQLALQTKHHVSTQVAVLQQKQNLPEAEPGLGLAGFTTTIPFG